MPKHPENPVVDGETPKTPKKQTKKTPKKTSKKTPKKASEAKKKRGVPCEYDNKVLPYLKDIEKYARCGVTEGQLAEYYHVGKTSWAKYKKDYPEFAEILCKAKRECNTDLINRAYQVAMGYEYEEETTVTIKDKAGNVTGTKTTKHKRFARADGGMLQFLLINRNPDEFARDPQILEPRRKALELAEQGKTSPDMEGI